MDGARWEQTLSHLCAARSLSPPAPETVYHPEFAGAPDRGEPELRREVPGDRPTESSREDQRRVPATWPYSSRTVKSQVLVAVLHEKVAPIST